MSKFRLPVVSILGVLFIPSILLAAPTIKVLPTTQSIEKGGVFQIRVEISTTEPISDIIIAPVVPDGFK